MYQKEWEILVVDDDPDMLAVTRLATRPIQVYGVPLKVHTCASMAEAVALLNTKADLLPALAVALIDVVMETDTAGLDLCRFIREERRNPLTQLFIRTGQPGLAPERAVIDRYDVNGYFTKAEATDDKLYSMIKSGVRQYYWSAFALGVLHMVRGVNEATGSRAAIANFLQQALEAAFAERTGSPVASYANVNCSFIFGDEVVANVGWSPAQALAARDELDRSAQAVAIGSGGDSYTIDANHRLLVKASTPPGGMPVCAVSTPTFRVPEFVPAVISHSLACYAASWQASR